MILEPGALALLKPRMRVPRILESWFLSISSFQIWIIALTGPCFAESLKPSSSPLPITVVLCQSCKSSDKYTLV